MGAVWAGVGMRAPLGTMRIIPRTSCPAPRPRHSYDQSGTIVPRRVGSRRMELSGESAGSVIRQELDSVNEQRACPNTQTSPPQDL